MRLNACSTLNARSTRHDTPWAWYKRMEMVQNLLIWGQGTFKKEPKGMTCWKFSPKRVLIQTVTADSSAKSQVRRLRHWPGQRRRLGDSAVRQDFRVAHAASAERKRQPKSCVILFLQFNGIDINQQMIILHSFRIFNIFYVHSYSRSWLLEKLILCKRMIRFCNQLDSMISLTNQYQQFVSQQNQC